MKINRGNFESNLVFLQKVPILKTPQRILEVGSGMGTMVAELSQQGHQVTGTEVNPDYIAIAKEEFGVELVPLTHETALPFPDASFDVVMSFDVFEHIPDTRGHLAEVRRVLAPGGVYLIGTPNKWTNIPFEILKRRSFTKYREYHMSVHSYGEIKNRLARSGFRAQFVFVPLVNEYFLEKMQRYLGGFGVLLVKVLKPDSWPQWMKTNFYIIATKKN